MTNERAFLFNSVDSTNEAAKRLIRDGAIDGRAYVLAREQTAGRGQRGRLWLSPLDAGIYLTVIDRPRWGVGGELHAFTRAAGIACVETLFAHTQVRTQLKPINDLYVDGRKLAGILTEAVIKQGDLHALMTGVGVNVRKADRPLPPEHVQPVCLEELMPGKEFAALDLRALVRDLVQRIRHWNAVVSQGDLRALEIEWQRYYTVGSYAARPQVVSAPLGKSS